MPFDKKPVNGAAVVILHFTHGSVPRPGCEDQRSRLGGKWGGHVELEIDDHLHGFELERRPDWHLVARRRRSSFNCVFEKKPLADWLAASLNDKRTSIALPVTAGQKDWLLEFYERNGAEPPYDYAFLGMRCAASMREVLGGAGILSEISRFGCLVSAFYPRQFRRKMLRLAAEKGWQVTLKPGIECRDWD